jgi:hypothetical protein
VGVIRGFFHTFGEGNGGGEIAMPSGSEMICKEINCACISKEKRFGFFGLKGARLGLPQLPGPFQWPLTKDLFCL